MQRVLSVLLHFSMMAGYSIPCNRKRTKKTKIKQNQLDHRILSCQSNQTSEKDRLDFCLVEQMLINFLL